MPYSSRSALPSALPQARSCVVIGVDLFLSLPSSPRVLIPLSGCCPATTLQRKKRSRTRYARRCRRRGHTHPPAWVHRASPPAPTRAVSHPRAICVSFVAAHHHLAHDPAAQDRRECGADGEELAGVPGQTQGLRGLQGPGPPRGAKEGQPDGGTSVRPSVRPHTRRHLGLLRSVALRPPLLTPTHPVAPPLCLGSSDGPDG